MEVGHEIELQALAGTLQGNRAEYQHHHYGQQAKHHHFGDLLHAVLQSAGTDQHTQHHDDDHKQSHQAGLTHQGAELIAHSGGIQTHKVALEHFYKVEHQPTGNGGVEHHQQIVAGNAEPAVDVPLGSLGLQSVKRQSNALLAGPAHGKLHDHYRKAHDHQEQQVHQHKGGAAVLTGDIGKAPHISQTNGTACRNQ